MSDDKLEKGLPPAGGSRQRAGNDQKNAGPAVQRDNSRIDDFYDDLRIDFIEDDTDDPAAGGSSEVGGGAASRR
jgi:hypothetical protein